LSREESREERYVEDFSPSDFELRKKALPKMKAAFDAGLKVWFTKGKLLTVRPFQFDRRQ